MLQKLLNYSFGRRFVIYNIFMMSLAGSCVHVVCKKPGASCERNEMSGCVDCVHLTN
jgi:hypothetical protein